MTFDYARAAATAEKLIEKFGQTVTLIQITNSSTEWEPELSEASTSIKAVDLSQQQRDAGGTLVGHTVRTLYISTSASVTPTKGDKVKVNGKEHEITEVRPLAPGGVDVFWEADLAN